MGNLSCPLQRLMEGTILDWWFLLGHRSSVYLYLIYLRIHNNISIERDHFRLFIISIINFQQTLLVSTLGKRATKLHVKFYTNTPHDDLAPFQPESIFHNKTVRKVSTALTIIALLCSSPAAAAPLGFHYNMHNFAPRATTKRAEQLVAENTISGPFSIHCVFTVRYRTPQQRPINAKKHRKQSLE